MNRPVLFIARSWQGHGGMQRLNRDVCQFVGGNRQGFVCLHPAKRSRWSFCSFCIRALVIALHWRGNHGRVHVGDAASLPLGVLCAWLANAPLSVTACGLDVIYAHWWYQFLLRRCLRFVDHVIAISDATKQEVIKRGVPDDHITVIPCGIDPSLVSSEADRSSRLLLTVGRLVQRKGVAWFLEHVFPQLLASQPNLHYCIVGDGPERRRIISLIQRLQIQHAVTVMTHVSDEERSQLLNHATVFIVPNIQVPGDMEGFGIVCVEAAAAGTPVVAANIEGLHDAVLDGSTGKFFPAGNAHVCAEVIEQILKQPFNPVTVHNAVMHRFAWTTLAPLYANVFDS